MTKKKGTPLLTALLLLAGLAGRAEAASISYYLDQSNTLADGTNYLLVTIDDEGAAGLVNFTVDALAALESTATGNFGIQSFGFNTALSLTEETLILPADWSASFDQTMSGFGNFDVQLSGTGSSRLDPLTFSIDVAGDTIGDYAGLSSGNAGEGNVFFAAHVAGFDAGSGVTSAYFGGSTVVPVPPALVLLASGLAGLAATRRRRQTA